VEPHEDVSETVIEGIGLAGDQRERPNPSLKRGAIAEIETRDEGGVVTKERNGRDTRGD